MNLPHYPSPEVKEFGERVASALVTANIRKSMHGLGGCKAYDPDDFDPDVLPYVEAYFEGNLDALAIIYAAMWAKEME